MCPDTEFGVPEHQRTLGLGGRRAEPLDTGPLSGRPQLCGQLVFLFSEPKTSEVGRLASARAFFPALAPAHFVAQAGREFTVRKCLAFPAAVRKETASCSNPQKSSFLKPHVWAELPSWDAEMLRVPLFLSPPGLLLELGVASCRCMFLFCFFFFKSKMRVVEYYQYVNVKS